MEAICTVPDGICLLTILANTATAFMVMAPFAATRLLVLRMRAHSAEQLQPA